MERTLASRKVAQEAQGVPLSEEEQKRDAQQVLVAELQKQFQQLQLQLNTQLHQQKTDNKASDDAAAEAEKLQQQFERLRQETDWSVSITATTQLAQLLREQQQAVTQLQQSLVQARTCSKALEAMHTRQQELREQHPGRFAPGEAALEPRPRHDGRPVVREVVEPERQAPEEERPDPEPRRPPGREARVDQEQRERRGHERVHDLEVEVEAEPGAEAHRDRDPAARALTALVRAAMRHGGLDDVRLAVIGPVLRLAPLEPNARPVLLGDAVRDFGAGAALRVLAALGGTVEGDGDGLEIRLPARSAGAPERGTAP